MLGCNFRFKSNKFTYPFPKSEEVREKWFQKLNKPNFNPSPSAVICYKHFHEHDFIWKGTEKRKRKRILKPTAVPSLLLFDNDHNFGQTEHGHTDEMAICDGKICFNKK